MTLSTALKQTADLVDGAVTDRFIIQSTSIEAILTEWFNGDPTFPTQTVQTSSIIGDGLDYLFSFDTALVIGGFRLAGKDITLFTRHNFLNATNATLIVAQDETDYDAGVFGVGQNGHFIGGTGHLVSDVITLDCDSIVTVDAVSGGVVTQFTVTTIATGDEFLLDNIRRQVGTDGSGIGFHLFPRFTNMVDFINAYQFAIEITSFRWNDVFGIDQKRNNFNILFTPNVGDQYNIGTFIFKTTDDLVSNSLVGSITFRSISYVKVKR